MTSNPRTHILCALPAEAWPMIKAFRLQRLPPLKSKDKRIKTYFGSYHGISITLCVGGVGQSAAAHAVHDFHLGETSRVSCSWLNVGIVGHRTHTIGTPLLANKISMVKDSAPTFYPTFAFRPSCQTVEVLTVKNTENKYDHHAAFDMEAHGFFAAAATHTTSELIHCFKVVSDNTRTPPSTITSLRVTVLIASQLQNILTTLLQLNQLLLLPTPLTTSDPLYQELLSRWHFTYTQRHQLLTLLQRLQTCSILDNLDMPRLQVIFQGKDVISGDKVLHVLRQKLASLSQGQNIDV